MEAHHLDETLERFSNCIVENDSHRQRLVELQSLAGLCKKTKI
jgi:hypothetical protein